MDYTEKTISAEEKYHGRIINVHLYQVELCDGHPAQREIVEHSGGVAIIPVDENGNVLCVRQYRYATGEHILEIPAGKLNKGEDPQDCAVRELSEETGCTADSMVFLGKHYPSPGYCRETLYIYLATGLHQGEAHLDPGEFLDVESYPLDTLYGMAMRGEILDGKTIIAVLKAKLYLQEKGTEHG